MLISLDGARQSSNDEESESDDEVERGEEAETSESVRGTDRTDSDRREVEQ